MIKRIFAVFGLGFAVIFSQIQTPTGLFSGESAFKFLEQQVAFGPRNPGSEGHKNCQHFLIAELKKYTINVSTQPFLFTDTDLNRTFTLTNIIAHFPGKAPQSQRILLAAHWDTRPRADREKDPELQKQPILGANDGASGVAVLLEIARIMVKYPPPVPVDVVLFDGEDYGKVSRHEDYLLGARHFAKNLPRTPYKFGILLDMVGDKNLRIPKEGYSARMLPDLVDKVWKRAQLLKLSVFINRLGSEILDDHQPLIQAGVPIIDIIHVDLVGSKYWHTLEDTPDKCSPESLKQVGTLLLSLIYEGLGNSGTQ